MKAGDKVQLLNVPVVITGVIQFIKDKQAFVKWNSSQYQSCLININNIKKTK